MTKFPDDMNVVLSGVSVLAYYASQILKRSWSVGIQQMTQSELRP